MRSLAKLAAVVAVVACVGGCRTPSRMVWGRTPAAGATTTCPDDAVDLTGDRTPTSDHVRCSYADAGMGQARVTGTVLALRAGNVLADAVEGAEVALVPIDAAGEPGAAVATTRTDAQGRFTLGARARAGRWTIVVGDARAPSWTWDAKGPWTQADVRVQLAQPRPRPQGASAAGQSR